MTARERFEIWWNQEGREIVSFLDNHQVDLAKMALLVAWLNGSSVALEAKIDG
jgi:hypothetical protein